MDGCGGATAAFYTASVSVYVAAAVTAAAAVTLTVPAPQPTSPLMLGAGHTLAGQQGWNHTRRWTNTLNAGFSRQRVAL